MNWVVVEVDRVKGSSTMRYVLSFRPWAGFKGDGFDLVLWVQVAPAFYAGGYGRPESLSEEKNQGRRYCRKYDPTNNHRRLAGQPHATVDDPNLFRGQSVQSFSHLGVELHGARSM